MSSRVPIAAFLPPKPAHRFIAKSIIYGPGYPCNHLYLVQSGRVVISNRPDGGNPMVSRVVGANGMFGEAALNSSCDPLQSAMALDEIQVTSWSRAEVEDQVTRDPGSGLALLRYFAECCAELNARIEAIAFHKTPDRVMLALLQLADNLGTPAGTCRRLEPLTHQVIADYVGTSREIVTSQLTAFRREGLLTYSRKHMDVEVGLMRKKLGIETAPMVRGAT